MRKVSLQRTRVRWGLALALSGLVSSACGQSPAAMSGSAPPDVASGAGTPPAAHGAGTVPAAPVTASIGPGETPVSPSEVPPSPVVGAVGLEGVAGSGAAGAPPLATDCPVAEPVPVNVSWSDVNEQEAAWYTTPEARSLAENLLYYRNADRGWPKDIDMTERTAPLGSESTIDNDATTTQIEYLARVHSASSCSRYGDAVRSGIEYLLEAQYDNGGWPQVYPNPDGYHAHVTFNDNAMVHVLNLLREVSAGAARYAFVGAALGAEAAAAVERGIDCILAAQVVLDGVKTGWCAQHDEVTLAPAQARTYELPSLSGSEGANLLSFLMTIEEPSPAIREAVQAAAAWFRKVEINGIRIQQTVDATQPSGEDRVVVEDPSAPPLWARFYELGSDRPIFSSRCEVPECDSDPFFMRRYTLAEIDNERRVGYSWYGSWPARLLATTYPAWQARWAP